MKLYILLFLSLSACTSTKKQNHQENFEEFKNKFYSDSVFQMSRIKFPLPLKVEMNYDTINNKFIGDTLAWGKKIGLFLNIKVKYIKTP